MTLCSVASCVTGAAKVSQCKVAVSGASGFIGSHLLELLKHCASAISLRNPNWAQELARSQPKSVIHLAGFAHGRGSEEEIRKVNVDGTKALATEAARHAVRRFVFISSIQALAETTVNGESLNTNTSATPQGAYGRSKFEAEQFLRGLSTASQMEMVIIRAPLVYGAEVKANFRNLFHLVDKGIPMPLITLDSNRRSFVGVSNLIDLILLCLENPAAANQTFHVSDDDDVSTAELLRRIGKALGKPVRNIPIPQSVLKTGLRLAGKGEWVNKLCGDLRVDISETKQLLGWKPKVTMEEELERTAHWWKTRDEKRD